MNKLIIVEGPQGVGKTTVSNWLRENITYSNLYRLTGHSDKSWKGLYKSRKMYDALFRYIVSLEGTDVNLIFDRTFTTEEVYCRLGYREYNFTPTFRRYARLLAKVKFDVYIINLKCMTTSVLYDRLSRNKKQHLDVKFDVDNSLDQQAMYSTVLKEITGDNIHHIDIDTSLGSEYWQHRLSDIFNL